MRWDLDKQNYNTNKEYNQYIYGSADALMCLKVFVGGIKHTKLKPAAMALGSAFQKVNFLRDLNADFELLERSYFPNVDLSPLKRLTKSALSKKLRPILMRHYQEFFNCLRNAVLGHTPPMYYFKLLMKLKRTPSKQIKDTRIRVPNYQKMGVLARSYVKFRLNLL